MVDTSRALRCVVCLDGVPQSSLVPIIWQRVRFVVAGLGPREHFGEGGEPCAISSLGRAVGSLKEVTQKREAVTAAAGTFATERVALLTPAAVFGPKAGLLFCQDENPLVCVLFFPVSPAGAYSL